MTKLNTSRDLDARLITFASNIVQFSDNLMDSVSKKHLGSQLLRSGTSPALNYAEARDAESAADFIHKMKVCLKELRETFTCLKIINNVFKVDKDKISMLISENNELIAIFVSIINTARKSRH